MKARRRDVPSVLSDEIKTILLDGPYALGKTLWDIPRHDDLRKLWSAHRRELKKARPHRRTWFEDRDLLVRTLRGEA